MTSHTKYFKYSQKYSDLLNEFFRYFTVYKLEAFDRFPKESNIVIFDNRDQDFSSYSNRVLKNLLKNRAPHVLEVRKTGGKGFPWKISEPINFLSP